MRQRLRTASIASLCAVAVVCGCTASIYYYVQGRDAKVHASGLVERMEPVMVFLASVAEERLRAEDEVGMSRIPDMVEGIEEIVYVTITGGAHPDDGDVDHVWASTDSSLVGKTAGQPLRLGEVRLVDELTVVEKELRSAIDEEAAAEVGVLSSRERELLDEVRRLAALEDEESREALGDLIALVARTALEIETRLGPIGSEMALAPPMEPRKLAERYLFYRPLVYRTRTDGRYFRGMIRLGVSASALNSRLTDSRRQLRRRCVITAGISAAAAVVLILGLALALPGRPSATTAEAPTDQTPPDDTPC